jgi:hypothetical protein
MERARGGILRIPVPAGIAQHSKVRHAFYIYGVMGQYLYLNILFRKGEKHVRNWKY